MSSADLTKTKPPLFLRANRLIREWWSELLYSYHHKKDWQEVVDEAHLQQLRSIHENLLFLAAKENDVKSIKELIKFSKTDIFEKGALGETALHIAALFNSLEAAVALIEAAPDLINEPIVSDFYEGVTALHIAVINENMNFVQELIHRGAEVDTPRATGECIQKKTKNLGYFGEHILSFAACTGKKEIVQLLIENGADIRAQDKHGNTVLHILVFQPNRINSCKIYDLIMACDLKENHRIPLDLIQNSKGLTPFKLAAAVGNSVMFQHIVNLRRIYQSCLVPRSTYLYDLSEIDSWADDNSVLELIICSESREACSILEMTPVKQLVKLKWMKYARHYFRFLMLVYILYIIIFTLCCIFRPLKLRPDNATDPRDVLLYVKKSVQESYITYSDHLRLVGELISVIGAVVILLLEIPDILRVGPTKYFGQTVLGGPFHVIIIIYSCLLLILLILRVTNSDGEMELMAFALVLAWCNVLFFFRGFEMLGPYIVIVQKVMFSDMLRFICLMTFTVIGFTAALWMAYMTQDPSADPQFGDFPTTFFVQFELSLGLLDIPLNYSVWTPNIVKVLHAALTIFGFLLIMNLLIAMLGDTQTRLAQERDEIWRGQVVATIIMLERRLPRWMWIRFGICGKQYGLENKWYLRVESSKTLTTKKRYHNIQTFNGDMNKSDLDESYKEELDISMSKVNLSTFNEESMDQSQKSLQSPEIIFNSPVHSFYFENDGLGNVYDV
uniref:Transient receptor potential cation channel subfamily V member 6-like n=1 Tax=Erpetoichthys calabaricus TaxID=27687 RepID=A0A8C4S622_ERPCA